jgi:hypothetical protein
VDYRALKEGRTIELMNFFHFDGAEMTLRHITLTGVTLFSVVSDFAHNTAKLETGHGMAKALRDAE